MLAMILALQNAPGQHLGFVLFADDAASNDCVVRPLPKDAALFNTPEFRFLEQCRAAGEFKYSFKDAGRRLLLSKPPLSLRFERQGLEERYVEVASGLAIFGVPYDPPKRKG
jgi:hypothetical protein